MYLNKRRVNQLLIEIVVSLVWKLHFACLNLKTNTLRLQQTSNRLRETNILEHLEGLSDHSSLYVCKISFFTVENLVESKPTKVEWSFIFCMTITLWCLFKENEFTHFSRYQPVYQYFSKYHWLLSSGGSIYLPTYLPTYLLYLSIYLSVCYVIHIVNCTVELYSIVCNVVQCSTIVLFVLLVITCYSIVRYTYVFFSKYISMKIEIFGN